MNDPDKTAEKPADAARRRLLAGLLDAYVASLIPAALIPQALAQPVTDAGRNAFMAVSGILAGRPSLDAAHAARLYDALVADDPGFPASVQALLALINDRKIDPLQLQKTLDDERSPLAPLPRNIVTAWFMGIVGSGEKARVLAYETALNAMAVADVLRAPTYCYGVYGSWTEKPT
ncbi:MAG TPA: sugar dehydrogenase complex small subunit [Noviherbaspirillum sp.]|nr:sugar dehydrogenase complex small subunit [Noviherbaspirillum sp.]